MLCRTNGNRSSSEVSSQPASGRPSSRDSHSDYSNPTSFSSQEPPSGKTSPVKQDPIMAASPEKKVLKKKSGFFQNHSPFRRKSIKEVAPSNRNTWHPSSNRGGQRLRLEPRPALRRQRAGPPARPERSDRTASPDPIDANASLALNVGQNVFRGEHESQNGRLQDSSQPAPGADPIALALAELKGVTVGKQSSVRMSADQLPTASRPRHRARRRARRRVRRLRSHARLGRWAATAPWRPA